MVDIHDCELWNCGFESRQSTRELKNFLLCGWLLKKEVLMTGTIYIIKNKINSKVYIRKTLSSIDKRFDEHKRDSLKYTNRVLYRAFNKYGLDNFFIEELEKTSDEKVEEREIFYIKKYNSYIGFSNSNGYNSTLGGDGKKYFAFSNEEVIEKYRELKYISYVANFTKEMKKLLVIY